MGPAGSWLLWTDRTRRGPCGVREDLASPTRAPGTRQRVAQLVRAIAEARAIAAPAVPGRQIACEVVAWWPEC